MEQILGWSSRAAARASFHRRFSAAGSADCPGEMSFRATVRSSRVSRARNTAPIPPWPIFPWISKGPKFAGDAGTPWAGAALALASELPPTASRGSSGGLLKTFSRAQILRSEDDEEYAGMIGFQKREVKEKDCAGVGQFANRSNSGDLNADLIL